MRRYWIPVLLFGLMLYVVAGTPLAPFHGDESTLIYGSRDYFDQFVAGDMERVMNRRSDDANDHGLRLLEGRVQKYLGGFAFHLSGGSVERLNRPWQWGAPPQVSIRAGFVPSLQLLMAERWAMAVLLALSIPLAYAVGSHLGGIGGGLAIAILIALSPNLVLNGRRVMMEAPLLLFSLLTVLAAIRIVLQAPTEAPTIWPLRWRLILLFGLAGGMAVSSKHSGLLTVVPLFVALGVWTLLRNQKRGLVQLAAAGAVAAAVFLALNPAWWSSPLDAAGETLLLRSELMRMQTSAFGGYSGLGDATAGFARFAMLETPQYFEVPFWQEIGPSIAAYRASPWVLPSFLNTLRAVVTMILAVAGIVALVRRRDPVAGVAGAWIASAIIATYALTPLAWARYYLPALPAIYALAAAGVGHLSALRLRP